MKNKNTIIFKILILLTAIVTGLGFAARTQASEVTEYSQQTSITKDGEPLTSDSTVKTNETLSVTTNFTFPAAQTIAEGDTLTFKLPEELSLITALNFDVYDVVNHTGELVGTAQTDPVTQSVKVTFQTIPKRKSYLWALMFVSITKKSKKQVLFPSNLARQTFLSNTKR